MSNADWTRPVKTGATLPATCRVGELFFLTTAPTGQNLNGCVATNVWTPLAGPAGSGGDSSLPSFDGTAGRVLTSDGTEATWTPGDVSVINGTLRVGSLQGLPVSTQQPANGEALVWSNAQNQWKPFPLVPERQWMPGVARTSDVTLTIGAECTQSTPCRVRFGKNTRLLSSPATVQILSGTGTAWVSVSASGAFQVGYSGSMTVNCSNCALLPNAWGFPNDSLALWHWTASTERRWDTGTGTDYRALLGRDSSLTTGSGLISVEDPDTGAKTFMLDTAVAQTHGSTQSGAAVWCPASSATPNAYTCALNPLPQAYTAGMVLAFRPAAANTGPATLNAGAGAAALVTAAGAPLQPLELSADQHYHVIYTGTQFRLLGTQNTSSDDSSFSLSDEFVTFPGPSVGTLGWTAANLYGSAFGFGVYSDASEPGYVHVGTAASGTAADVSEGGVSLRSAPDAVAGSTAFDLSQPSWVFRIRVRVPDTTVAGAILRAGFFQDQLNADDNSLYVQYQQGSSGGAWALYNGAVKVGQSTVAAAPNTWHWITVTSVAAGSVMLKVDDEAGQTFTTTLPGVSMAPGFSYRIPAGSWSSPRSADLGKWSFRRTGVIR